MSASASTDDVKDIISKGIGISSDKLTLYVCAHVCSFDEGSTDGKIVLSRLGEHPRVLSRVRFLGVTGVATIICIVSRADYQASRLAEKRYGMGSRYSDNSNNALNIRRSTKLPASAAHRLLLFMTSSPFRSEELRSPEQLFSPDVQIFSANELLASNNFP